MAKPVIYLYPPEPTTVCVDLRLTRGAFTCLLPAPAAFGGKGRVGETSAVWQVRALPDGTLEAMGQARNHFEALEAVSGQTDAPPLCKANQVDAESDTKDETKFDPDDAGGAARAAVPVASLFWEAGLAPDLFPALSAEGGTACVRGGEVGDWLLAALQRLGLTPREYTEMASYWAPKASCHKWVLLRFLPQVIVIGEVRISAIPRMTST